MRRVAVTLLVGLFLAGVGAGNASARNLFKSEVAGIAVGGQTIAGIGGGAPWDAEGEAKVNFQKRSGLATLKVEVEGLVLVAPPIPADPVFPVIEVFASLICQKNVAGDPTNEQVTRTGNFPLSAVTGDVEINDGIELPPEPCVAPIVLIRIGVIDVNFVSTGPTGCNFGAGPNCMVTGVPLDLGFTGPWIAASGL